jgi:hypothetical protein
MLKFTSEADLLRINPNHPAFNTVSDLVRRTVSDTYGTDFEYQESSDGFICLIESTDLDRPLTEIWGDDAYDLLTIPWEGICYDESQKNYLAVFVANNSYSIAFVIPREIVHGELKQCFELILDE